MKWNRRISVLAISFVLIGISAYSSELKIGILSFNPTEVTESNFKPLTEYIESRIPELTIHMIFMTDTQLENALKNRQIDVVLTNPSLYILYHHRYNLSPPLLTLVRLENHKERQAYGGAIFTLSTRDDIQTLSDICDKQIAIPFETSFGGFQMQQYELYLKGLPLIPDSQILVTGLPHDNVLLSLLNGKADVGFVRAGTLERMATQNIIDIHNFKLINKQPFRSIPYGVSTHLYPEWPLATLPHLNPHIKKQLLSVLLQFDLDSNDTQSSYIKGFIPPVNYDHVEALLKDLRIQPFNHLIKLDVKDVWDYFNREIIIICLLLALIIFIMFRLVFTTRVLKSNKVRLDLAIESSRLGTWDWNTSNGIVKCNDRWAEMLGWSHQELSPITYNTWVDLCHPDDREKTLTILSDHMQGKRDFYESTLRMKHKSGHWVWVNTKGMVVAWNKKHTPSRIIGTHEDISEKVNYEEKKLETEISKSLTRMAAAIAHNFNNALTAVLGNLELACTCDSEHSNLHYINEAKIAADKAASMSKDMLIFLGQTPMRKTRFEFNTLASLLADYGKELIGKKLHFEITNDCTEKCYVNIELENMKTVFQNIMLNANEAIGEQKGTVWFKAETGRKETMDPELVYSMNWNLESEEFACLTIIDTGPGIQGEKKKSIFEPYFTEKFVGRGMGLSKSVAIIRNFGGGIGVKNSTDKGAIFKIYLPLSRQTESQ